jgi:hypothetical protein
VVLNSANSYVIDKGYYGVGSHNDGALMFQDRDQTQIVWKRIDQPFLYKSTSIGLHMGYCWTIAYIAKSIFFNFLFAKGVDGNIPYKIGERAQIYCDVVLMCQ